MVTVTYRCECSSCGRVWTSDEYADRCDTCDAPESGSGTPNSTYKGYRDHYTGYYGVDWRTIRERVLERDDYRCVECGLTDKEHKRRDDLFGGGLHIHHIEPSRDFDTYDEANRLSNLEARCATCHRKAEKQI